MQSAIPVQERPARNALTVVVSCVNRRRRPVADATRSSARPAFLPSSAALEARSRGTSGEKKGLGSDVAHYPAPLVPPLASVYQSRS